MIVIDFSQLIFNNLFVLQKSKPKVRGGQFQSIRDGKKWIPVLEKPESFNVDESINLLKHLVINQILMIANHYKSENEIVLATDQSSWRKKDFVDKSGNVLYKAARKEKRDNDDFDWDAFWKKISEFQIELSENFPFNHISIKYAEGDDIIGVLAEHIHSTNNLYQKNEKFIIISSDKDFMQLQKYKNVIQYSPLKKKELKCVNPANELLWLILQGDRCDGIPNVKSPDDAFITGKTVRMWNSKDVWRHIENNTVFDSLILTEELKQNFQRNRKLIDLRECPIDIKEQIIAKYEENKKEIKNKSQLQLFTFLVKNKMKNMIDRISEFERFFINKERLSKEDLKPKHESNSNLMNFYKNSK